MTKCAGQSHIDICPAMDPGAVSAVFCVSGLARLTHRIVWQLLLYRISSPAPKPTIAIAPHRESRRISLREFARQTAMT